MDPPVLWMKLLLIASLLVGAVLSRGPLASLSRPVVNGLLALLALVSLFAYTNLGTFHGRGYGIVHTGDMFHYYLSAKYFPELGYDGLYGAALRADAESKDPYWGKVKRARDLSTSTITRAASMRSDSMYRDRFSDERWMLFRADIDHFKQRYPEKTWRQVFQDHGYNAPPSRAVITHVLTNLAGPASERSLHALAGLDLMLLVLAVAGVWWAFGYRSAVLGALFFGCASLSNFDWIGGSLLRYAWLVLTVLGVCALERGRYLPAGFLLGAATVMRGFPAFFALGVVLGVGLRWWRGEDELRKGLAFVAGLSIAGFGLVLASLLSFGGAGPWEAFFSKIQLHLGPAPDNHVGLRGLVGESWLWPGRLVAMAAYGMVLPRVNDRQAAILGILLIYAFGFLSSYYYCFAVLIVLWAKPPEKRFGLGLPVAAIFAVEGLAGALILVSNHPIPLYDARTYFFSAAALLVVWGSLIWAALRPALPPEQGT